MRPAHRRAGDINVCNALGAGSPTRARGPLELAKSAFEREVQADRALRDRARASAERQIRALLTTVGFAEVHFVETLPGVPST